TRDPDLGKVVLYQLSYSRKPENRPYSIWLLALLYGSRIIRADIPIARAFLSGCSRSLKSWPNC
ncbi:hypothetical protein, partial [Aeromonas caviae]|uniref:hypothetical protein n=1 Tax=Aeromonas caviae TaxID=648 RepID=UPI002B46DE01